MKIHFAWRTLLLATPFVLGLAVAGCDDDDAVTVPVAPREPTATPTPMPTTTATATPAPNGGQPSDRVGILGRIHTMNGATLGVGAFDVITNESTAFFRGGAASSLDSFSIDEDVRVAGTLQDSRTIVASKVSLLPDPATAAP